MTRYLCIIIFMRSLLKLSHKLYLHLHMCSLLSLLNVRSLLYLLYMCSLLKCDYFFCNHSLSHFVILRLELHVYIMLTFMFCEINDIYIYIYNFRHDLILLSVRFTLYMMTLGYVDFRILIQMGFKWAQILASEVFKVVCLYCLVNHPE